MLFKFVELLPIQVPKACRRDNSESKEINLPPDGNFFYDDSELSRDHNSISTIWKSLRAMSGTAESFVRSADNSDSSGSSEISEFRQSWFFGIAQAKK